MKGVVKQIVLIDHVVGRRVYPYAEDFVVADGVPSECTVSRVQKAYSIPEIVRGSIVLDKNVIGGVDVDAIARSRSIHVVVPDNTILRSADQNASISVVYDSVVFNCAVA